MFETDKLIYLQLQKTGCSHIASLLEQVAGGEQGNKHKTLAEFDTDKYVVGSIRNPWSWHVSLWAFGCKGRGGLHGNTTRRLDDEAGRALWTEVYADPNDPELFRRWVKMIYAEEWRDAVRERFSRWAGSSYAGLLTYRYLKLHVRDFKANRRAQKTFDKIVLFDREHNILDGVIRTEYLEDDFLRVLEEAGHVIDDRVRSIVEEGRVNKTNASRHHPTAFYYDDETATLIAERERFIIEKYAYEDVPGLASV